MEYQVIYERKRIRSIRLHVKSEHEVICSYPFLCLKSQAEQFVESKRKWIEKTLQKVLLKAQNKFILKRESVAVSIGFSENDRKVSSEGKIEYSRRWKEACIKIFHDEAERYVPMFDEGQIPRFEIKGRSMKTLWGSCNRTSRVITLNWELLNFDLQCLDYVVLHELCHFLVIHHDRNFYAEVEKRMPDYKEAVKRMK